MRPTTGILASVLAPDLRESLSSARLLGYAGVQLPLHTGALKLTDLTGSGQREVRALLAREELGLLSLTTTCGRRGFSPGADIDRVLSHLGSALKAAADLGCPALCVDVGPLPPPAVAPLPKPPAVDPVLAGAIIIPDARPVLVATPAPEARDEAFESLLNAALLEVGQLADRYGVVIAWRSELGALASLHAAMSSARCPLFTLDLDPVAVLRDTWDLDRTLGEFAGQVGHVRLRDALKGTGGRTQPAPLGQGHAGLRALLAALDDAAYSGPLVVDPTELPNRQQAARAASEWLGR